jgi:hypothetical protein
MIILQKNCIIINWMKNKKVQILEFGFGRCLLDKEVKGYQCIILSTPAD